MDANSLITAIIVGLIAGWIASRVMGRWKYGVVGYIVVGVLGSFVGTFLFGVLGVSIASGLLGSIITATVGAVCLLFLIRALKL